MQKLPKFKKPPVAEVLCCVYFQELLALNAPHLGALWEKLGRDKFSRTQTAPPLPPVNVSLVALITMGLQSLQTEQFQLPRTIFTSGDGTSLIQVQRDRLVFNWKRGQEAEQYPSYDVVIENFKKIFADFLAFAKESEVGDVQITGLEVAYINHFDFGRELSGANDIETAFPLFAWRDKGKPVFNHLSAMTCNTQFELPDGDGQFHMAISTAQRRQDGKELVRLDFIARKLSPEIQSEDIWPWFNRSHERIVTTFADVTSARLQRELWERVQ